MGLENAGGDRERWDARYAEARSAAPRAPDPFALLALDRVERSSGIRGRALDLASGAGRHALELARRGWTVEAWDVSSVALERLEAHARELGRPVETRAVDLARDPLPRTEPFDVVVLIDFLDRGLLGRLCELVGPEGHLIVATFTVNRPGDHPRIEWCLERGELARGIPGFETLLTSEERGRSGFLGRRSSVSQRARST